MLFDNLYSDAIERYYTPPLPFLGNKTKWLDIIRRVLLSKHITKDTILIDLFGGSGLVAHNLKYWYPNNRVIYNDFDNYRGRLKLIPITNEILIRIRKLCLENNILFNTLIPPDISEKIIKITDCYSDDELDFITLSANLKFSGKRTLTRKKFCGSLFYLHILNKLYNADGYLKGVEVVTLDYKDILNKYKDCETFLIVDPPYINTITDGYSGAFTYDDTKNLISCIKNSENYLFFTSRKSDIEHIFKEYGILYQKFIKQFSAINKGKIDNLDYMLNPIGINKI